MSSTLSESGPAPSPLTSLKDKRKSKYKRSGMEYRELCGKWRCRVKIGEQQFQIGQFTDEDVAFEAMTY